MKNSTYDILKYVEKSKVTKDESYSLKLINELVKRFDIPLDNLNKQNPTEQELLDIMAYFGACYCALFLELDKREPFITRIIRDYLSDVYQHNALLPLLPRLKQYADLKGVKND